MNLKCVLCTTVRLLKTFTIKDRNLDRAHVCCTVVHHVKRENKLQEKIFTFD